MTPLSTTPSSFLRGLCRIPMLVPVLKLFMGVQQVVPVPSVPASGLGRVDPLEQKKPPQHCPPASVALAPGQNLPLSQARHPTRLLRPGTGP